MIRITFWTAFFLVALRVCIGWHFFFEGVSKVKSAYLGKATANDKPFSSETYFRESESWLGRKMKPMLLGDPDGDLAAKFVAVEGPMPEPVAVEWSSYTARFAAAYGLDDTKKAEAEKVLETQQAKYLKWLADDSLTVKRKAPGANPGGDFEIKMTPAKRVGELLNKAQEVRDTYAKFIQMGKDVDGLKLRTLKTEVNTIRDELQKEYDDQFKLLKDALANLLEPKLSGITKAFLPEKDEAATVLDMLQPMADGKNPLSKLWDDYAGYVKEFSPKLSEEDKNTIDARLAAAKIRFDHWVNDRDMFTGETSPKKDVSEWKALFSATPATKEKEAERKALIAKMQADFKNQTDALRTELGKFLGDDRAKGYVTPVTEYYMGFIPKMKPIEYMDWSTRWFLAVVGSMIMFGIFTRTSSFLAAGFLLMTNLIQPSVPWLPVAPNNEGNYLFVNKNMVEMFALLVLMTTRSGLWAGVDAIIEYVFGRNKEVA